MLYLPSVVYRLLAFVDYLSSMHMVQFGKLSLCKPYIVFHYRALHFHVVECIYFSVRTTYDHTQIYNLFRR